MNYYGKRFDTFDMALGQMLEKNYGIHIRDLDCISLRCFGYRMGESIEEWFQPFINPIEAVKLLTNEIGISFICRKIEITEVPKLCKKDIVIGPLKKGFAVSEIREEYYDGKGHYIFISRMDKLYYQVFDPYGMAGLILLEDEILSIFKDKITYAIYINDEIHNYEVPSKKDILNKGIQFHKTIYQKELLIMKEAIGQYKSSLRSRISLQYGIMNLIMQLDKVFVLIEECGQVKKDILEKYAFYKIRLYQIMQSEEVSQIIPILKQIWRMVYSVSQI